jgi:thiosulfate dehydrogenase (quinone) large subunit
MDKKWVYSRTQLVFLVALRVAIGWHLMYEGLVKIFQPGWSSYGYLMDSKGWFSDFFHNMAANTGLLIVVDFLNMWGLTLVGFAMIAGVFTQIAKVGALIMLLFYFVAHPPLMMADYIFPGEGSYLWVNKNLIEFLAVGVLFVFPTGHIIGIDRLLRNFMNK